VEPDGRAPGFSGDMARLDAFSLNVLCNHEVIEIDQDTLGRQARVVRKNPAGRRVRQGPGRWIEGRGFVQSPALCCASPGFVAGIGRVGFAARARSVAAAGLGVFKNDIAFDIPRHV